MIKKYFTTGLIILLPIVFTILIAGFLVNIITAPFFTFTEQFLKNYLTSFYTLLKNFQIAGLFIKFLVLVILTLIALVVGFVGRFFILHHFFQNIDKLIHHVPFINKIYKATQDVIHSLFSSSSKSFTQVVLVPFPSYRTLSIGLVTKESISLKNADEQQSLVPVFIPGTPNPSVGFLLMFRSEQLTFIDMGIEDAMKFVVSCGVVMSPFIVTSIKKIED